MSRELWSSRTGFILAAAGSAVGLGNIWKFPYLAGKFGGGAFLLAYLILVFTIVKVVMLSEIAIGRAANKNAVGAFASLHNKRWKIVGYMGVVACFMVLSFYSVVAGWTIYYTVEMLIGSLSGLQPEALTGKFEDFIADPSLPVIYHGIFMLMVIAIVIRGIKGGIEKVSTLLMPALFIIIIALILRGFMLDGAMKGLEFYLVPDWSQLGDFDLWSAALGQAFFSLSLGMGTMLTYGSYLDKKENLPNTSFQVAFIDTAVAFLAGLLVFPAVFSFGFDNTAGPGLTFIILPAVFNQMFGGQLFGILFFILLFFAALTSAISILEVMTSYWSEEKGVCRKKSAVIFGLLTFFMGVACSYSLGIWADVTLSSLLNINVDLEVFNLGVFDFLNYVSSNILLPLGGLLILIFAGWIKPKRIMDEITNNGKVDFYWKNAFIIMTKYISPIAIGYLLLNSIGII